MRPEISRLMKHFYNDLEDHPSIMNDRPNILGVASNIFFIQHKHPELDISDGKSKQNRFEAEYASALADYLLKQGYQPEQITILVMYLGQRQLIATIRKNMDRTRKIRIAVISRIPHSFQKIKY